ncbi:MAG TPA: hypothetical protein VGL66_09185 [Caulobacteraceae bacterium]|jgi:hypothetical protein
MAAPIRPLPPAFTPPVRPNDRVSAAQRAFFQTAVTGVAPAPAAEPAKAAQPAPRVVEQADVSEPADRWARPGSRLDIKV